MQTGAAAALIGSELLTFISFLGEMTNACKNAVLHPRRIRWKETFYYMNVCGADGLPITVPGAPNSSPSHDLESFMDEFL